ncbi:hypothetical protein FHG87_013170 [Trinorchestia longiramus]|nr:hypothetical protein FHG87_013170 [Trinorchestia longiramus]
MDNDHSKGEHFNLGSDGTDFDLLNSLDATQGSLSFNSEPELNSIGQHSQISSSSPLDSLQTQVPQESSSEKIIRLTQKVDNRQTMRWQMQPIGSYDSLSNMIFFGNMSLEEKHFTVPQSSQEIHSAAELHHKVREEVFPSFQDPDLPELMCDDGKAELEKFHEILAQRQAKSTADDETRQHGDDITNSLHQKTNSSSRLCSTDINLAPLSQDQTNPSSSLHHDFTLITEAEFANTQECNLPPNDNYFTATKNDYYEQLTLSSYPRDTSEAFLMQCSIPNSSLTNLEHPSYQLRFRQDSRPNVFQNLKEHDESPPEHRGHVPYCSLTEKAISSSADTISHSSKPIVISCKEKKSKMKKEFEFVNSPSQKERTRNSNKDFSISRRASDLKQQRRHNFNRNSAPGGNFRQGSFSCPSLDKMEQEECYFNLKSRPNMLYNLEVSSLSSKFMNQRPIMPKKRSFDVEDRKVISLDDLTSLKKHEVGELFQNNLQKYLNNALIIFPGKGNAGKMYPSNDSSSGCEEISDVMSYGEESAIEQTQFKDIKGSKLNSNNRHTPQRENESIQVELIRKYQNYISSNFNSNSKLPNNNGNYSETLISPHHSSECEVVKETHRDTSSSHESLSMKNNESNSDILLDYTITIAQLNIDADSSADDQRLTGVTSASCADRLFNLTQKCTVVPQSASEKLNCEREPNLCELIVEENSNYSPGSYSFPEKQLTSLELVRDQQEEQIILPEHIVTGFGSKQNLSVQHFRKTTTKECISKSGVTSTMYSGIIEESSSEDSSDSDVENLEVFHHEATTHEATASQSQQFGNNGDENKLISDELGDRKEINLAGKIETKVKCDSFSPSMCVETPSKSVRKSAEIKGSLARYSVVLDELFDRKPGKSSETCKLKSLLDDDSCVRPSLASANNTEKSWPESEEEVQCCLANGPTSPTAALRTSA